MRLLFVEGETPPYGIELNFSNNEKFILKDKDFGRFWLTININKK